MKKISSILILIFLLTGCKTWDWGEIFYYEILEGNHSGVNMPVIIEGTEKWGGEMTLTYNPGKMIDPVENFSYWNKLGGLMPSLDDNFIVGKHQSARAAWRVDPLDTEYIYIGYIVYVWGQDEPQRGYLLDGDGNKVRVKIRDTFFPVVTQYSDHWGVGVKYNGQLAEIRVNDEELRREKFLVVMDPYYGDNPVAPTTIYIRLEIMDTTWIY